MTDIKNWPIDRDEWPLQECPTCGSLLCDGNPCQIYGRAGAHCAPHIEDDPDWRGGRPVPNGAA